MYCTAAVTGDKRCSVVGDSRLMPVCGSCTHHSDRCAATDVTIYPVQIATCRHLAHSLPTTVGHWVFVNST